MTLTVPDEIALPAQELAASTGESAENLFLQTLYAHFPPASPELQAEFDAWEQASDEDMIRLNEQEDLGWHEAR
jgi:hypothetical protein